MHYPMRLGFGWRRWRVGARRRYASSGVSRIVLLAGTSLQSKQIAERMEVASRFIWWPCCAKAFFEAGRRCASAGRQPTGADPFHLDTDGDSDHREDDTEQACHGATH